MAVVRVITYYHRCDACGKAVPSDGTEPKTGVLGKLEWPDSAYGQRSVWRFYSCKEQAAHIIKAMRVAAIEQREANVQTRKNRGEAYSAE